MTHEFDGKKYATTSAHQKEWGRKVIEELNLSGKESILGLGCGDGSLTRQLAERVAHGKVLGIDSSLGMLAQAEKNVLPNLTFFRRLDINELDEHETFDIIFSNAALHWILNHEKMLHFV